MESSIATARPVDVLVMDETQTGGAAEETSLSSTGSLHDQQEQQDEEPTSQTRCKKNPLLLFINRTKTIWSQLTVSEMSGSMGDLGTFIPIVVAMARERCIILAPALFFAGLANVITGYCWDCPMPVQPMKSIAAVALAESLTREEVTAAGLWMGIFMVVLGVTQLIELVNIIVPSMVVSGLQMGVGIRLATRGITMIAALGWVDQADCILLAVLLSVLCLYWLREPEDNREINDTFWGRLFCQAGGRQHPTGLYLFLVGCVFATIELATTDNANGQYDFPLQLFGAPIAVNAMESITPEDYKVGLLQGAIPQLPLTTLNSVISVCCLAHSLYPEKRKNVENHRTDAVVSRREVSISVGLMNLLMCPFGAMPNCHGAGGLAGQHRLGARHGASVVFLGTNKMLLAIFFGASALTLLDAIPDAVLGVMLAIAGQELTTTGFTLLAGESFPKGKLTMRKNTVIATITAIVIVGSQKTQYGALTGWVAYMIYGDGMSDFVSWIRSKWNRRRGSSPSSSPSLCSEEDHVDNTQGSSSSANNSSHLENGDQRV